MEEKLYCCKSQRLSAFLMLKKETLVDVQRGEENPKKFNFYFRYTNSLSYHIHQYNLNCKETWREPEITYN